MPAAPEHRPVATEDAAAGRRSLLTVAVTTDPVAQPPRKLKKKTVDRVGKALRKAARAAAGAGLVVEVDLGALTAAAGRATIAEPPAGRETPPAPAGRETPPTSKRSAGGSRAAAPGEQADEVAGKQTRRTRPGGTAAPVRTRVSGAPATGDGASDTGGDGGSSGAPAAKAPRAPRQSRPALRRTPARPPQP